jgi:hypothetical protein
MKLDTQIGTAMCACDVGFHLSVDGVRLQNKADKRGAETDEGSSGNVSGSKRCLAFEITRWFGAVLWCFPATTLRGLARIITHSGSCDTNQLIRLQS